MYKKFSFLLKYAVIAEWNLLEVETNFKLKADNVQKDERPKILAKN